MIESFSRWLPWHRSRVIPTSEKIAAFRRAQRLAYEAVTEVGSLIEEGWTEKQAAELVGTHLRDAGIRAFFHEPYAWFGDRTRFAGINRKKYSEFNPTFRRVKSGDAIILDVAPILDGCVSDIGYSMSLGKNAEFDKAQLFLKKLRGEIPKIVNQHLHSGGDVWKNVDAKIKQAGYDNIHWVYPFHVLGHRLNPVPFSNWALRTPVRFSLHSFWQVLSNGFKSELLTSGHKGSLAGLWAIEPHVGWKNGGAKFEEILVVDPKKGAFWLDNNVPLAKEFHGFAK